MAKMVVAFGGLAGILGLFLPFIEVLPRYGTEFRSYGLTIWNDTSLFDVGDEVGGFVLLAFWIVVELIALQAVSTFLSRRQAVLTLLLSLPPAVLSLYWLAKVLSGETVAKSATAGAGLIMLSIAGVLTVLGSCLGIAKPDRS